jgi:REP element-mobilizing transposase RayT
MYTRRSSLRLKDFDYSATGPYFITTCIFNKQHFFDNVQIREQILLIIKESCQKFSIKLYAVIVAVNHIHLLIELSDHSSIKLPQYISLVKVRITQYLIINGRASSPLRDSNINPQNQQSANSINIWQRGYYDHIIRNEQDYLEKAKYIENHPFKEEGDLFAEWH